MQAANNPVAPVPAAPVQKVQAPDLTSTLSTPGGTLTPAADSVGKSFLERNKPVTLSVLLIIILGSIGIVVYKSLPISNQGGNVQVTPTSAAGISITPGTSATVQSTNTAQLTPSAFPGSTSFSGTFVTASLPANWSITESSNFSGETVSEGTYTGLARLTLKYNDDTIMIFRAGNGVGDPGMCANIYKFNDTSAEYVQDRLDFNEAMDPLAPDATIVDLTNSTYSEFTMLGNIVRRAENKLYFKNAVTMPGFNPGCGFTEVFREFTGLTFFLKGDEIHNYFLDQTIPATFTNSEMQQLEQVLQSLKPV